MSSHFISFDGENVSLSRERKWTFIDLVWATTITIIVQHHDNRVITSFQPRPAVYVSGLNSAACSVLLTKHMTWSHSETAVPAADANQGSQIPQTLVNVANVANTPALSACDARLCLCVSAWKHWSCSLLNDSFAVLAPSWRPCSYDKCQPLVCSANETRHRRPIFSLSTGGRGMCHRVMLSFTATARLSHLNGSELWTVSDVSLFLDHKTFKNFTSILAILPPGQSLPRRLWWRQRKMSVLE